MENVHTNCDELFTVEVLRAVKPSAEKWAKRTHGALSADDLIQAAVLSLWNAKENVPILDPVRLLTHRVRLEYCVWTSGTNSLKHYPDAHEVSPRQRYISSVELPTDEGSGALSTGNPVGEWEKLIDIEHAIHTLNADEQQLVRWRYWEGLGSEDIGAKLHLTRGSKNSTQEAIKLLFRPILKKLQVALAAYE
jgi:RNA polymerase sigma factor (sigma-70 family)